MGLILPQTVTIVPSGKLIEYYRDKGYDAQWRKELIINVIDLTYGSKKAVKCNCDYCNDLIQIPYSKYCEVMSSEVPKIACKKCINIKREECVLNTYGVKNVFQLEEVKEKIIDNNIQKYGVSNYTQTEEYKKRKQETCLDRYGTKNPLQNEKIKEKVANTCYIKYGTKCPAQNQEIKNKIRKTVEQKYGVSSVLLSEEVKSKIRNSMIKNWGVATPFESPEILKKAALTFQKNQTVATSRQQKYIYQLYGGEINGVVSHYNCDIVFREEKMIVEYDGGGHQLGVEFGTISEKDFKQKELIRDKEIKREGFRIVRIISRKDYLPSDTTLLQMLQYARDFFTQNPDRSWLSFDLDNNCIYNAYHKETDIDNILFYNFGKLRKIENIENIEFTEPVSVNINSYQAID